jgi:hypothetical protein
MNAVSDAWEKARSQLHSQSVPLCITVREKPKLTGDDAANFVRYELNKITRKSLALVEENIVSSVQLLSTEDGRKISLALASTAGPTAEYAVRAMLALRQKKRAWFTGSLLEIPKISACNPCFVIQLANIDLIDTQKIHEILKLRPFPHDEVKLISKHVRDTILQDDIMRQHLISRSQNLRPSVEKYAIVNFLDSLVNNDAPQPQRGDTSGTVSSNPRQRRRSKLHRKQMEKERSRSSDAESSASQ